MLLCVTASFYVVLSIKKVWEVEQKIISFMFCFVILALMLPLRECVVFRSFVEDGLEIMDSLLVLSPSPSLSFPFPCPNFFTFFTFFLIPLLPTGVTDVWPSDPLVEQKEQLVENGYNECVDFVRQLEDGTILPQPGFTREQTLEGFFFFLFSFFFFLFFFFPLFFSSHHYPSPPSR